MFVFIVIHKNKKTFHSIWSIDCYNVTHCIIKITLLIRLLPIFLHRTSVYSWMSYYKISFILWSMIMYPSSRLPLTSSSFFILLPLHAMVWSAYLTDALLYLGLLPYKSWQKKITIELVFSRSTKRLPIKSQWTRFIQSAYRIPIQWGENRWVTLYLKAFY